jgi:hypothetical protein
MPSDRTAFAIVAIAVDAVRDEDGGLRLHERLRWAQRG